MKVALSLVALASLWLDPNLVHAHEGHGHPGTHAPAAPAGTEQTPGDRARGTVFLDQNGNGRLDRSERGIAGVSVSNGLDVVQTDARGQYALPLPPESILFISKPADYEVPVDENNL